ncbi:MAG: hypothetical protein RBT63_00935 [Bdellovibrionales bacterium]|nr:hypothetical protein [Bdellovibrionales bacterium]
MKRRFSLFTLVLIAISIGTAVYLPASLMLDIQDKRDVLTIDREKRLVQYLGISKALYQAGADESLTKFLLEMINQNDISYVAIYKQGELTSVFPPNNALAAGHEYQERAQRAGHDLIDSIRSERSEYLSSDLLLTLGIDKRYENLVIKVLLHENMWKVVVQDILTIIFLAGLVFWLHTRDLAKLKREIRKTGRVSASVSDMSKRGIVSAEAEAIAAGFRGYASSERGLKQQAERLSPQVLPALKRELFSGQEPPYTFDCTLVRTDINGFSQIFNSPYRDRFAQHIDEFFTGLTEIVSRYDGLISEFIGDEVIFYFKDIEHDESNHGPQTSVNRAIDAVRDIGEYAKMIDAKTRLEGHPFTVKSALAHGALRFGKQVDGYSLSGGLFIETVRILSTVTEKAESQLYFAARHTAYLREDIFTEPVGDFNLKGYTERTNLVRFKDQTKLSNHLARVDELISQGPSFYELNMLFDFVRHHKSDTGLEQVISKASSKVEDWTPALHLALVESLRDCNVYRSNHSLAPALLDWLTALTDLANSRSAEWYKPVSSILMLFPCLVPRLEVSGNDLNRMEAFLDVEDMRTVANTISVLTHYDSEPQVRPLAEHKISTNNRVAANALILSATQDLNRKNLDMLEKMIFGRSSDETRRASGLYALGEIARILKSRDPVYFSTRVELHRLLERIEPFIHHKNESIANQARRALAKSTDEEHIEAA